MANNSSIITGCQINQEKGSFDNKSWIIAVVLAVFAALVNNLGVNLQKLAWTKKQSGQIHHRVYGMYWVLGMAGIILASVFDFVALAFGPQSVIGPIGSLTMVTNGFIAPMMHGEKLHKSVIIATAIIIVGCVMSVASASHVNETCDIAGLFGLYKTYRFMGYALVILFIFTVMILFIRHAERVKDSCGQDSPEYRRLYSVHRVSYAAVSGLFGAQSVVFARSLDLLVIASTRGGKIFLAYYETYLIVAALVACIVLQLYWLNHGLARFDSLYNVPVFTSTWIVGTVVAGGIFYQEFAGFTLVQAILFPLGIFISVCGVFLLSRGTAEEDTRIDDNADEESQEEGAKLQVVSAQSLDLDTPGPDLPVGDTPGELHHTNRTKHNVSSTSFKDARHSLSLKTPYL